MKQLKGRKIRRADKQVEIRVLLASRRTCCICHQSGKPVQLHHIDGDPSRTTRENLAVLCLDHHHEATAGLERGRVGLARKMTPDEVRAAKLEWEGIVARELSVPKKLIAWQRRRQLETLLQYDLIKWRAEIRATSSPSEIRKIFKILQEYNIEEFITGVKLRRAILGALTDLALGEAGEMLRSRPILSVLKVFTWHLVGPSEVSLLAEDRHVLLESFKILEIIGGYAADLQDNPSLLRETCVAILEHSETCFAYQFQIGIRRAHAILRSIRKRCVGYEGPRRASKARKALAVKARLALVDRSIRQLGELFTGR
jgi:hypothetical protein